MLREAARYWGKAGKADVSTSAGWHPLAHHSLDVAATGVVIVERMPALQVLLGSRLGLPLGLLKSWLAFWLALHDLGKFAEAFQSQRPDLFAMLRGREPDPNRRYRQLRHDSLGMLFWTQVVKERLIADEWFGPASEDLADGLDCWMRACTGHHGQPPQPGGAWAQHFHADDLHAAMGFVDAMRARFLTDDLVAVIKARNAGEFLAVSKELSWWAAGVAVLADWLGSNKTFFPYQPALAPVGDYWAAAQRQAQAAVGASGVVAPPHAAVTPFPALFPSTPLPTPLQAWASDAPLHDGPQVHLLEDVTGAGKTEAALMLTHRLIAAGHADGFFVALPTMATANAMYSRVANIYPKLFAGPASLVLAHGQRGLVGDFAATVVEQLASAVLPPDQDEHDVHQADDTASAQCAAWLADHHKRALLAPAGIGTIDQALLAVLQSKHQSLRLLGLLNKGLVVDEVHACDDYMEGVLAVLLEFHARAGGSAVLLSATLPQRMRQRLLGAFARGLRLPAPQALASDYPLATTWPSVGCAGARQTAIATRADVQRRVRVHCSEHIDEVVAAIRCALNEGQCVCWVRNTVADAMAAAERVAAFIAPERLMLFHARFALHDRLAIEQRVLACFAKASGLAERRGRLLIATQVVEQSLDVDFDLLVTDLAPIDRVVQRAGRLRRHVRAADGTLLPAGSIDGRGEPVLWVLQPPWQDAPDAHWYQRAFPKAAAVYPHHAELWLTARALRRGHFTMPDDARGLIEGVFGEDADVPDGLRANALAAEGHGFAALTAAQMNTVKLTVGYERGGIDWWGEARTPSRLGDATSQVALARWADGRLRPWVDRDSGWAYSSLRVPERLIAEAAPTADAALAAAIEAVQAELPAGGRWMVLLPLVERDGAWVGEALGAAQGRRPQHRMAWRYDDVRGLQRDQASETDDLREDPGT